MARTLDGVDDQIAFGSEAAIDDLADWTAMALIRPTANITVEMMLLTKFNSGYVGKIYLGASNQNKLFSYMNATGGDPYSESVADTLVPNVWQVVIATFTSSDNFTSQRLYRVAIGGAIAEVSYAVSPGSWSGTVESDASATLRIGARDAADAFYAGGMAENALWNRILTADEIHALGRGFAPAFFPRGRVAYSMIDGRTSPERNWAGTTHGTVTGTTYLDHPPVIYPSYAGVLKPQAAGGSFKAAWACGCNVLLGVGAR